MATAAEPTSPAARFLEQPKQMLIDGEWVEARQRRTREGYEPALGEVIDHGPSGDAEAIVPRSRAGNAKWAKR